VNGLVTVLYYAVRGVREAYTLPTPPHEGKAEQSQVAKDKRQKTKRESGQFISEMKDER
jgi:hypothetical protein